MVARSKSVVATLIFSVNSFSLIEATGEGKVCVLLPERKPVRGLRDVGRLLERQRVVGALDLHSKEARRCSHDLVVEALGEGLDET